MKKNSVKYTAADVKQHTAQEISDFFGVPIELESDGLILAGNVEFFEPKKVCCYKPVGKISKNFVADFEDAQKINGYFLLLPTNDK